MPVEQCVNDRIQPDHAKGSAEEQNLGQPAPHGNSESRPINGDGSMENRKNFPEHQSPNNQGCQEENGHQEQQDASLQDSAPKQLAHTGQDTSRQKGRLDVNLHGNAFPGYNRCTARGIDSCVFR